jgi:hypothetical protein
MVTQEELEDVYGPLAAHREQNPHSFLNLHNILAHASVLYVPAPSSLVHS